MAFSDVVAALRWHLVAGASPAAGAWVTAQNSWFSPPKIADTESSAKTFMIVSASR